MTVQKFKKPCLFLLAILFCKTLLACKCSIPTIQQEYDRSSLVVRGKIVGIDTVQIGNSLTHDRRGIKYGNRKYRIGFQTLVRVKLVVERNYKSATALPDTIFILTSLEGSACGYPFPPYHSQLSSYYDFIVYGDRSVDYSIQEELKGKRRIKQIKKNESKNTFLTSSCRLTQRSTESELIKLESLKT